MNRPNVQLIGNLAMGGAVAIVVVSIFGGLGAQTSPEAAAALGTIFGGLFQRFSLFGGNSPN